MKRTTPEMQVWLVDQYATKSLNQLSRETGFSVMGIRNLLVRRGVKMRPKGDPLCRLKASPSEVDEMVRLAAAGSTLGEIAEAVGRNESTVARWLKERGANVRPQVGANSRLWKGGRHINSYGYVKLRVDRGDPLMVVLAGKSGSVAEHRLVMSRHLGRALRSWETVHHVDGDKQNNRIENLQLRIGRHGKGVAYVCACCGSANLKPVELEG